MSKSDKRVQEANLSPEKVMHKLVSLAKRRGFIFPSSEIYGGLSSCFDYGPLGSEMKKNIKDLWWNAMTRRHQNIVGIDASIMMNPTVWEASGHVASFNDPLIDEKTTKRRYRADHLIENHIEKLRRDGREDHALAVRQAYEQASETEDQNRALYDIIVSEEIKAPDTGANDWTDVRQFNLMFQCNMGAVAGSGGSVYLRPETAQGIFVNFHNVREAARMKVPFGIAQIGKAFRNEIVKGNFIFRMVEFEQMEMQYFVKPGTQQEAFEDWREERFNWYTEVLGISRDKLHWYRHDKLAHYADLAYDIKFQFPFGIEEIEGIHSRTDFDLKQHQEYSGKNMEYIDQTTNERYIPYVVETSSGCDRLFLALLSDAYTEDIVDGDERVVLKLSVKVAPVKAAVLPLMKKGEMGERASKLRDELAASFRVQYDDAGSIGKRYRRQDEIGTPFCFTVDHQTLEDNTVTVRYRDSAEQERMPISNVREFLALQLV
ncbi:glycine--tRNA ligase [Prosthecochloris sp. N3]|uniref:Glycine--tRNA ligase n=1 Tax=Prosthecochloris ethylica TaxID=2743976 RepID=A0ABR9XRC4_9CHLB|nr:MULTISPECIES: glycine--tRNA ligase [Prosthecochloris]MEC9487206.1 glycine--tRNA ligase [Prosthecochloris sp.]MBF0586003.1 glycine--tRNA ligase [Prosthecochloris ethylica]MBF0636597.1 glycine--tRNA ligase [Prosthecochloris ethylica]NUK47229.1 glycine--tRNA ligase [Prosthecochloris ethylica]RNA64034.1 glycine--tRNA ligase [Prosthecochloris sp. ZM_2]